MRKYLGLILSSTAFACTFIVTGCAPTDVAPFIDNIATMVGGWMGFAGFLAAAIEVLVRVFPTVNPKSIFLLVAEVSHASGRLFESVANFLDSLGLQNVKGPQLPGKP